MNTPTALESVERAAQAVLVPAERRLDGLLAGLETAASHARAAHEVRGATAAADEKSEAR